MNNNELLNYLNQNLTPEKYQDYCPNGLQIEGKSEIYKIVTGVSISEKLIDTAIKQDASAIIVHHGLFWNKDEYTITGIKRNRIAKLLEHGINLYAYHLPLDNHPELGNNAQLAKKLGLEVIGQDKKQNLLWYGKLANPTTITQLAGNIESILEHKPLYFANQDMQIISRVAWCTGGAQSIFELAIKLGVDAYITGEVSEPIMNLAHESNVAFIAAGHYATERYGIMALTEHLQQTLNLDANFIELYNPV
jgi:dinuclear metal center YbgI/SA1388 family protein